MFQLCLRRVLGLFEMRFNFVLEVRSRCVRGAFQMRLKGVSNAFYVCFRCVSSAFETRLEEKTDIEHHPDLNRVRAISLQDRYENIYIYIYVYVCRALHIRAL